MVSAAVLRGRRCLLWHSASLPLRSLRSPAARQQALAALPALRARRLARAGQAGPERAAVGGGRVSSAAGRDDRPAGVPVSGGRCAVRAEPLAARHAQPAARHCLRLHVHGRQRRGVEGRRARGRLASRWLMCSPHAITLTAVTARLSIHSHLFASISRRWQQ